MPDSNRYHCSVAFYLAAKLESVIRKFRGNRLFWNTVPYVKQWDFRILRHSRISEIYETVRFHSFLTFCLCSELLSEFSDHVSTCIDLYQTYCDKLFRPSRMTRPILYLTLYYKNFILSSLRKNFKIFRILFALLSLLEIEFSNLNSNLRRTLWKLWKNSPALLTDCSSVPSIEGEKPRPTFESGSLLLAGRPLYQATIKLFGSSVNLLYLFGSKRWKFSYNYDRLNDFII